MREDKKKSGKKLHKHVEGHNYMVHDGENPLEIVLLESRQNFIMSFHINLLSLDLQLRNCKILNNQNPIFRPATTHWAQFPRAELPNIPQNWNKSSS